MVGQYCAPVVGAERKRIKIKPNIDLASIVYHVLYGVNMMSAVLKKKTNANNNISYVKIMRLLQHTKCVVLV